jgi:hypothetical protein
MDCIAMSMHPGEKVDATLAEEEAQWQRDLNGNTNYYSLKDVADMCRAENLALGFFEWSPKWATAKNADLMYRWIYDDIMYPNRAQMVGDAVHSPKTLQPDGADESDKQTAEGKQSWRDGVPVFKNLWGGIKPA